MNSIHFFSLRWDYLNGLLFHYFLKFIGQLLNIGMIRVLWWVQIRIPLFLLYGHDLDGDLWLTFYLLPNHRILQWVIVVNGVDDDVVWPWILWSKHRFFNNLIGVGILQILIIREEWHILLYNRLIFLQNTHPLLFYSQIMITFRYPINGTGLPLIVRHPYCFPIYILNGLLGWLLLGLWSVHHRPHLMPNLWAAWIILILWCAQYSRVNIGIRLDFTSLARERGERLAFRALQGFLFGM